MRDFTSKVQFIGRFTAAPIEMKSLDYFKYRLDVAQVRRLKPT